MCVINYMAPLDVSEVLRDGYTRVTNYYLLPHIFVTNFMASLSACLWATLTNTYESRTTTYFYIYIIHELHRAFGSVDVSEVQGDINNVSHEILSTGTSIHVTNSISPWLCRCVRGPRWPINMIHELLSPTLICVTNYYLLHTYESWTTISYIHVFHRVTNYYLLLAYVSRTTISYIHMSQELLSTTYICVIKSWTTISYLHMCHELLSPTCIWVRNYCLPYA